MSLPLLALGIFALILVHFALKGFVNARPETLRRNTRWVVYAMLVLLALFFLRLGLVNYAAIAGFFGFVFMLAQRAQMAARLWRWYHQSQSATPPSPRQKMTREEARAILGVGEKATHQEIQEAYRRLIRANHPDKGGTEYLASQINLARDTLLDS